jgi:hypothetical protein
MKIDQDLVIIGILLVIIGLLLFRKVSGATPSYEYTSPTSVNCPAGFTTASPLTAGTPNGSFCVNGKQKRGPVNVMCPSGWQTNSGAAYGKMCKRAVVATPPPPPPPPPPKPLTIAGPPPPPAMTAEQTARALAAQLAAGG